MSKSIAQITQIMFDFYEARAWDPHHRNPNHIIASILVELGELAEHYQWKSKFPIWDKTEKTEVGYEFVDVIVYIFLLAEKSGIDIEKCFDEKLPKLEKKFPALKQDEKNLSVQENLKRALKSHKNYRENGKNKVY